MTLYFVRMMKGRGPWLNAHYNGSFVIASESEPTTLFTSRRRANFVIAHTKLGPRTVCEVQRAKLDKTPREALK